MQFRHDSKEFVNTGSKHEEKESISSPPRQIIDNFSFATKNNLQDELTEERMFM